MPGAEPGILLYMNRASGSDAHKEEIVLYTRQTVPEPEFQLELKSKRASGNYLQNLSAYQGKEK